MNLETLRQRLYANSPHDLASDEDNTYRNAIDKSLSKHEPVLDSLSTTIHHHAISKQPEILVVEQYFKISGVTEFTLRMKHFDSYVTENPIRLYTNTPVWN